MAENSANINLYTNNLLSSNLANIILIFNDYYQIYLNGVDSDIIIDLFISKTLFLIFNKNLNYKLINLEESQVNLETFYPIIFNNINLATLYLDIDKEEIDINQDNLIKTFISYLSIFIYNSKFIKRPNLIQCSIFVEVLNMINDGVMILDNNFIMLFINNTANIILKKIIDYDNYINKSIFEIFSQTDDILECNKIYKNKKINFKINKNNIDIHINLNINTILHNTIYYNIITIKPINDNKKCDNIGFLSHELRNPLQSISFCNQIIQMKLLENTNNKKYLDIIDKSVYDMTKIINDILDIDRINSNQISLSITNINIFNLIQDIQFNFEKYNTNKNIDFKIILDNNLSESIYTDCTRLKQIINNILNNSVKYSKTNELNTITLSIYNDYSNNSINFSIKDTGIGIREDKINELLDLKPNISHNKNDSNGLGLFLCNKLALLLGGNIRINSTYKEGTEFVFSHPLKLGSDCNIIKKELENFNIFTKILIVDNNENLTLLFKDIIQNLKFKYNRSEEIIIDCCSNGNLICDMVNINEYDIIFMDIHISGINGVTLVKLLRKQYFNKKIIGTSSDININYLDPKINELFDSIIIKPFDENDILDKLKY